MGIYIVAKYGTDRSILELVRDLMVTYILTKFGADW